MQDYRDTRAIEKEAQPISYILVALMMGCAAWTFGALANRISPAWPTAALSVAIFFVAGERLYTYQYLKSLELFSLDWFKTLGSIWVVIIVVLKLITGLSNGWVSFSAEMQKWGIAFFENFMTMGFLLSLVLAVVAWILSGYFAGLLDEMGFDEALVKRDLVAISQKGEEPVHARLTGLIFSIGTVLVVFIAMVRIDMRVVFQGRVGSWFMELPLLEGGGASALIYFMLGMGLLSQTRFISLNTAWGLHGIPADRKISKKWTLYSLVFLVFVAGAVSLMPTRYSLSLLDSLAYIISLVYYVFVVLMQFFIAAILYFFQLINLFNVPMPETSTNLPELPKDPFQNVEVTPEAGVPWLMMFKSILSWALLLTLVGFALVQFIRQNKSILTALATVPGGRWLVNAITWLRKLFTGASEGIKKTLENGLERLRARRGTTKPGPEMGFLNLRRLDARQKVYYYYQALLRKSGEIGLTRSLSQTPYEFAATLDKSLPEAGEDVDSLTEAFIEARYSRHPVGSEKASRVKMWWEHVRKMLRNKKVNEETKKSGSPKVVK